MEQNTYFIYAILLGLYSMLFSKQLTKLIAKFQDKFNYLKFLERRGAYSSTELKNIGYPIVRVSLIIGGVFFILIGLLGLLGIIRLRP